MLVGGRQPMEAWARSDGYLLVSIADFRICMLHRFDGESTKIRHSKIKLSGENGCQSEFAPNECAYAVWVGGVKPGGHNFTAKHFIQNCDRNILLLAETLNHSYGRDGPTLAAVIVLGGVKRPGQEASLITLQVCILQGVYDEQL